MKTLTKFGLLVSPEITIPVTRAAMSVGEVVFMDLDQAQIIISDSKAKLELAGRTFTKNQPVLVFIGDGSEASLYGWKHIPPAHQSVHELVGDLQGIMEELGA